VKVRCDKYDGKYYGKSDGRKTYRYVRLIEGGRGREREREDNKGCPIIFLNIIWVGDSMPREEEL